MSAKTVALHNAIHAAAQAERAATPEVQTALASVSVAWATIAATLHPDIPTEFVTRIADQYIEHAA